MADNQIQLDLYKLEYEKAAERYENIYRSTWTIFSYLAAVTGGLLALGSEWIDRDALIYVAAVPLLFWFWTTYMPLDRYGNAALNRLSEIESCLNALGNTDMKLFTRTARQLSIFEGIKVALVPLINLPPRADDLEGRLFAVAKGLWQQVRRARFSITFLFFLLHILFFYKAIVFHYSDRNFFREKQSKADKVGCINKNWIKGTSVRLGTSGSLTFYSEELTFAYCSPYDNGEGIGKNAA